MRRKLTTALGALAPVVVLALLAVGCGGSDSSSAGSAGSTPGAKRVRVIYVMPSLENEALKADVDSARAAAEADGNVDFSVLAGSDFTDINAEIANLKTAVAQRPDAIIILPADVNAFARPLADAQRSTKIILLGAEVPGFTPDGLVLFPNLDGGKVAGRFIADHVPDGAKIGILHCVPGNPVLDDRVTGAKSQWTAKHYDIVATLDARCDNAKGRAVMTDMLSAHPDLDAVFSVSDSQTVGAVGAIQHSGRRVFIVSYDSQSTVLRLVKEGKVDGDVNIDIPRGGKVAIEMATRAGRGQAYPKLVNIRPHIVDASNVDEALAGS